MDPPVASPPSVAVSAEPSSEARTRLSGHRLVMARVIWAILVALSLGLFVTAAALYSAQLSNPDKAVRALLLHPGPSLNGYIAFDSHFILLVSSYLTLAIVLSSLFSVFWIAVGLVIFWRKSDDWMALFVALMLITHGLTFSPQLYTMYVLTDMHSPWRWLVTFVNILGWGSIGLFLSFSQWAICSSLDRLGCPLLPRLPGAVELALLNRAMASSAPGFC